MKMIFSSKGGQKPFLSILKNGGSVALNPTKKILPELLKQVGGIEGLSGLVPRREDGIVKMGTKMLKHDTLSLIDQLRRSHLNNMERSSNVLSGRIKIDTS